MEEKKRQDEEKSKQNTMFKEFYEMEEMYKRKGPPEVYTAAGQLRQCNEGKYEFKFSENPERTCVVLEVQIPKFMSTSLVKVDMQPTYVRLDVKDKITQLKFPEEILVEKSTLQRS